MRTEKIKQLLNEINKVNEIWTENICTDEDCSKCPMNDECTPFGQYIIEAQIKLENELERREP